MLTTPPPPCSPSLVSAEIDDNALPLGIKSLVSDDRVPPQEPKSLPPTASQRSTTSVGPMGNQTFLTGSSREKQPPQSACASWSPASYPSILRIWWLEIFYSALVIAAFTALVVTLATHQGKPLPQWPYSITINSLISIYIVILKSAMLLVTAEGLSHLKWTWFTNIQPLHDLSAFDKASRGPVGSLKLMWTLRGRHLVSSIGALITLTAFATDPFSQQVIRYYSCETAVSATYAQIPRSNAYTRMGTHITIGESAVPMEVMASVTTGLFNPSSINIQFRCPTGNCTFSDEYHSVAYCSGCDDVTRELNKTCTTSETSFTGEACNYTLPSGLTSRYLNDGYTSDLLVMQGTELIANYATSNGTQTNTCSDPSNSRTWGCQNFTNPRAARCSIFPCVKTYQGSVREGNITERVVAENDNWTPQLNDSWNTNQMVNVHCLPPEVRKALIDISYNITESTKFVGWDGVGFVSSGFNGSTYGQDNLLFDNVTIPRECVYAYFGQADMALGDFLYTFFNGSLVGESPSYARGPAALLGLYEYGNITLESVNNSMTNIANSLTAYVRQNEILQYNGSHDPVGGQVWQNETCVHIRWAWLAFPAVLVGMTIVFLTTIIIQMMGRNQVRRDWKSSSLPLLFHGLEARYESSANGQDLDRLQTMEDKAKGMKVKLSKVLWGWRFTEDKAD